MYITFTFDSEEYQSHNNSHVKHPHTMTRLYAKPRKILHRISLIHPKPFFMTCSHGIKTWPMLKLEPSMCRPEKVKEIEASVHCLHATKAF